MCTYKLTYFNVKGVGEPIRMILSYAGKKFEDVRIEKDEWLQLKPKTPFGKLPILEIDGKVLHQSAAICRYLGEEFGLGGSSKWENLQINMIADTIQDIKNIMSHFYRQLDAEAREKKRPELLNETIPFYLERLDSIIKNNGGYFVNNKLTWVDFYFAGFSETMESMLNAKVCEKYPHILQHRNNLKNIPEIKKWISNRPKTEI
ncbi:glutathione S-transferase-like isoform X2 [Rhodnius prolixus]|uniref:glutathione transferase n=2 Tax=Rhodnius TaxID=13248 RepID=R4FPT9_RHOPR